MTEEAKSGAGEDGLLFYIVRPQVWNAFLIIIINTNDRA